MLLPQVAPFLAKFVFLFRFPSRELIFCENVFGTRAVYAYADLVFPGDIFSVMSPAGKKTVNQFFPIKSIPINIPIGFVFNQTNIKATFARGSGTSAFKKRAEKKIKFSCIILPSNSEAFLPNETLCVTGFATNLYLNMRVFGK
jgi:ribosomal protein L2